MDADYPSNRVSFARRNTLRAAYPEAADIEVHVLGGAKVASAILGHTSANWVVHDYGSMHPRDFLAGIDVWIYFAHSGWVESFGRTFVQQRFSYNAHATRLRAPSVAV